MTPPTRTVRRPTHRHRRLQPSLTAPTAHPRAANRREEARRQFSRRNRTSMTLVSRSSPIELSCSVEAHQEPDKASAPKTLEFCHPCMQFQQILTFTSFPTASPPSKSSGIPRRRRSRLTTPRPTACFDTEPARSCDPASISWKSAANMEQQPRGPTSAPTLEAQISFHEAMPLPIKPLMKQPKTRHTSPPKPSPSSPTRITSFSGCSTRQVPHPPT